VAGRRTVPERNKKIETYEKNGEKREKEDARRTTKGAIPSEEKISRRVANCLKEGSVIRPSQKDSELRGGKPSTGNTHAQLQEIFLTRDRVKRGAVCSPLNEDAAA